MHAVAREQLAQEIARLPDQIVAGRVPRAVVDLLEVVEVYVDEISGTQIAPGDIEEALAGLQEAAPVVDAGELVRQGKRAHRVDEVREALQRQSPLRGEALELQQVGEEPRDAQRIALHGCRTQIGRELRDPLAQYVFVTQAHRVRRGLVHDRPPDIFIHEPSIPAPGGAPRQRRHEFDLAKRRARGSGIPRSPFPLAKPPSSPCRRPSLALPQHFGAQSPVCGLRHPEIPDGTLGRATDPAFSLSPMLDMQRAQ